MPIAEYATPSTKELPEAVRKYVKAHDGMLLANHGALTLGTDLFSAYYKMETIEHFANISLVARLLGGERLLSREEVSSAAGPARPLRHCGAGADLRGPAPGGAAADCQVVQAPSAPGQRLVPDARRSRRSGGLSRAARSRRRSLPTKFG